jgi:integrase
MCVNQILAKGLSPRSAMHALATLRSALGTAAKWQLVHRNAAALVDAPRFSQYKAQTLTTDQARALVNATVGNRLSALYTVALAIGLRLDEALALSWEDVDLEIGAFRYGGACSGLRKASIHRDKKRAFQSKPAPAGRLRVESIAPRCRAV